MSQYQVAIVEYPAKHLTGVKVRTTMQKAHQDCSALWQNFGPRMGELLSAGNGCPESYGVSVMLNAEDFDYWAAFETVSSITVPPDMASLDLPAGQYAKCAVSSLEKLGDGYMYLYETWPKSQSEYTFDEQAPCFELYPANWQLTDAFEIYMPLKKKA